MKIRQDRSRRAIGRLAERLGLGLRKRRSGILSVVTANMARAIRVISVQRGHDPRDYTLMAFGGAGPLHAARLARELDMGRVLVPANPGILCAMGLLLTDLRADFGLTRLLPATESLAGRRHPGLSPLWPSAPSDGSNTRHRAIERRLARTVDMRYHGQNYELSVAVPEGPISPATMQALRQDSARRTASATASSADGDPMQLVTLRVEATGTVRKAELLAHPDAGPDASGSIVERRPVWLAETRDFVPTPIYARERLRPWQPVLRPRHHRADGRHHPGATRHDRAGRTRISISSSRRRYDQNPHLILRSARSARSRRVGHTTTAAHPSRRGHADRSSG